MPKEAPEGHTYLRVCGHAQLCKDFLTFDFQVCGQLFILVYVDITRCLCALSLIIVSIVTLTSHPSDIRQVGAFFLAIFSLVLRADFMEQGAS